MNAGASSVSPWHVSGSYFEACNCEAVCPCRSLGGRKGGRSTYGICDFVLSWLILDGRAASTNLSGLSVVLAGSYSDDEPGSPWRVTLYLEERSDQAQRGALTEIFLGRAGGTTLRNFASFIGEVYAVRTAALDLGHEPGHRTIRVGDSISVRGDQPIYASKAISCGIPGHDHPGQEVRTELQRVDDPPLGWEIQGRCGFATDFAYSSEDR